MDKRYFIEDSEYREGFNMCWYFIKQITALEEWQLEKIYGNRALKVIFEDEKIEDIVNKYLEWVHDYHIGDEVEVIGSDKHCRYVVVHSNKNTCTLLNKNGSLTSFPKDHLVKTGVIYTYLYGTLEALGRDD